MAAALALAAVALAAFAAALAALAFAAFPLFAAFAAALAPAAAFAAAAPAPAVAAGGGRCERGAWYHVRLGAARAARRAAGARHQGEGGVGDAAARGRCGRGSEEGGEVLRLPAGVWKHRGLHDWPGRVRGRGHQVRLCFRVDVIPGDRRRAGEELAVLDLQLFPGEDAHVDGRVADRRRLVEAVGHLRQDHLDWEWVRNERDLRKVVEQLVANLY